MAGENLLKVRNSDFKVVLETLFSGAIENPSVNFIPNIDGPFRYFRSIEEAVKGLKRGHTLFVQIGNRFLNINFSKFPIDLSGYDLINGEGRAKKILQESFNGEIEIF